MAFKLPKVDRVVRKQWGKGPISGVGAETSRFVNKFFGSDDLPTGGPGLFDPTAAAGGGIVGGIINPALILPGAVAGGLVKGRPATDPLRFIGGNPQAAALAALRGESPMEYTARKRKEKKLREQEALRTARQIALIGRSRGIMGGAATGMTAEGTADVLAQLKMQDDQNQRGLDAQSMQTLQALLFLAGAL